VGGEGETGGGKGGLRNIHSTRIKNLKEFRRGRKNNTCFSSGIKKNWGGGGCKQELKWEGTV